jgi:hypothetical protein
MAMPAGEFATTIFKRVNRDDLGEFSMDSRMLGILMELDGRKSLPEIASRRGLDIETLQTVVTQLLNLKLITPVREAVAALDGDFLNFLRVELSHAVGPIAEILIEDAIYDLGHSISEFPTSQVAELVDLLSREIQREDKTIAFKQKVIKKIREKGY